MAGEKFYVSLPPVDALLFMKGREKEVKSEVQNLNLMDYTNSYTKNFNVDLLTLLCSPAPSAFVRKYWEQHHLKGTPMLRTTADDDGSLSFEPLHRLLSHTGSVVWGVLKALQIDPVVTMHTKVPPGPYLYLIAFEGEPVVKVGKFVSTDPNAPPPPPGKGHGVSQQFCVADRFKGHVKTIKLPVEWTGPWSVEKMELLLLVPAPHDKRNEYWVQGKLRAYAKEPSKPPYLQCKTVGGKGGRAGTSEFFDARLVEVATKYLNQVAITPDKCRKAARVALEWDDGDSSPAEEAQEEPALPALQEPAMPSFPAVAAAGPKPISAPYKCKLVWELENNRTKDHGRLLTTSQTISKNRMVVQFFEALNYL